MTRSFLISLCAALVAIAAAPARADEEPLPPDFQRAIAAQSRLIERNPGSASLHNDLGNLYFLSDHLKAAEEAYEAALKIDPDLVSARYNLGLLLAQTDRRRRAARAFRTVLKAERDHAWAHYELGVVRAARGRRTKAIRSLARALRLDWHLTDPAFNPHIVDNSLASSAILMAYSDLSPAALAPRTYENPERIRRLLVPTAVPEASPEASPSTEPVGQTPAEPLLSGEDETVLPEAEPPAKQPQARPGRRGRKRDGRSPNG